ncbi:MAG: MATE family efflux transporter [Oscillospiraceae bacterium]|nr:MATE family efflux transporter [Oscillospiraceae bacterium]
MNRRDLPRGTHFFTRDRAFYKTFLPLLAVITLQQLATLAVNLADNIMLGRYTELALSGATLVNQIQFVLQMLVAGIGRGVAVLGSQYWGKRETEPIRRIISVGVKFALGAGLVFCLLTLCFPNAVLSLYTNDAAVRAEGVQYLHIMCWTYLIFSVSFTLMYSLQSVETAFIGTVMSLSTLVINICLNYCLIYGNFGFPELGIQGAAVATLTSRCVELAIILVYILFFDKKLHMRLRDLFGFDFSYLSDFLRAALPMMISGFLWGVAQSAESAVLGHMSATVIAANSVASVISQIFKAVSNASVSAASVTIGMVVGQRNFDILRPYTRTLQAIFLCIGLLTGGGLFLARDLAVSFYTISAEAKALSSGFLAILSVSIIGTCYEYPVQGGIIAGGGDPKYQAYTDNLFMWLFTIPASAISAFVFDASPLVVYCFLKADQLLKCIPNFFVCNRYRWVKVLTRDAGQK